MTAFKNLATQHKDFLKWMGLISLGLTIINISSNFIVNTITFGGDVRDAYKDAKKIPAIEARLQRREVDSGRIWTRLDEYENRLGAQEDRFGTKNYLSQKTQ